MSDIAHLGPVELLTPAGEDGLRFFVDVSAIFWATALGVFV
jgi:hypothetical protein